MSGAPPYEGPQAPIYYTHHPTEPEESYYWSEERKTGREEDYLSEQSYYNLDSGCLGLQGFGEGPAEYYPAPHLPVIRVVKRRNTANKKSVQSLTNQTLQQLAVHTKERRRTQSINNAFADLRDCIPNVPADTKLSKIKTLRLATSYIGYLMAVLEGERSAEGFHADLSPRSRRPPSGGSEEEQRRGKGRTGWPQHVWALELKQEAL